MGVCAKCHYFRQVRPTSQLLAKTLGTSDGAVATALAKIGQDEEKVQDAEAQYKRAEASTGNMQWAYRPLMSRFCGLRENDAVYLIAEVKNAGSRCAEFEFKSAAPERRGCSDCAHRIVPSGPSRDFDREATYTRMAMGSVTLEKGSSAIPDALLNKHRESVGSRKAFEVSAVYASQGRLATKPEYLHYCGLFSTEDTFVVCILQNPHHTCSSWQHTGDSMVDKRTIAPQKKDSPNSGTNATDSQVGSPPTDGEAIFKEYWRTMNGLTRWMALSHDDKVKLRSNLLGGNQPTASIKPNLPSTSNLRSSSESAKPVQPTPSKKSRWEEEFDRLSELYRVARQKDEESDRLSWEKILAIQQAEEAELMKKDPEAGLQLHLHNQVKNQLHRSNMSRMRHEASMTIARGGK